MNTVFKNIGIWVVLGIAMLIIFQLMGPSENRQPLLSFSEFLNQVENQTISDVVIQGEEATGISEENGQFQTLLPYYPPLLEILDKNQVRVRVQPPARDGLFMALLQSWLPMLLIIGIWILFMRQMQGGGSKAMSFGKIKIRMMEKKDNPITFGDVAGIDEAREDLAEIVDFLSEPQKFERLGGEIPRGVLLIGNPGTGKTLLAKAIAGESGVPFFSISGSDFVEMFVGVGASRVRDLFEQGKKYSPCIIFVDEIDAVGRSRGSGMGGGNDEREQTLNQLLVEMDGFEANEGIIVIAATNRPDVLDPALLRPGRFDRHIVVPLPDVKGRESILKVHTSKIELAENVDLAIIAKGTPGFTGADLENLSNEAALWAARNNKTKVETIDFEFAKDKVLMGAERKSMLISDDEKRITAYHEAGHALVAATIPQVDPVHKVTIIPRGRALGVTQLLPDEDKHSHSKDGLMGHITMVMGGRAAEDLIFNHFTTGASDDLKKATGVARRMVCQWGMSETLGPLAYTESQGQNYLGKEVSGPKNYSSETAQLIDSEIKDILTKCYERSKDILLLYHHALDRLAELLVEKETITGEEVHQILEQHPPAAVN